jgi:hypothetical protein
MNFTSPSSAYFICVEMLYYLFAYLTNVSQMIQACSAYEQISNS